MIRPNWPAPTNVQVYISSRRGGESTGPFADFNLATHVGDSPAAVAANRQRLAGLTGVDRWQWLRQVHGVRMLQATAATVVAEEPEFITVLPELVILLLTL